MVHELSSAPAVGDASVAATEYNTVDNTPRQERPQHDGAGPEQSLAEATFADSRIPQYAWAMLPPSSKSYKKALREARKAGHFNSAPLPYTDDPSGAPATIYIFTDPAAAEAQARAARRSVVRDILVILFQLMLLVVLGLMCYQWYQQFNDDWRRTHAHIIKAETDRREQILSARGLTMNKS